MQISEAQHKTAGELVELIAARLGSGRAVHPHTAIASSARLAGSLLLRSFNLNIHDVTPGTVVLSNEANEQGPQLVNIFGSLLQHFGVQFDPAKLGGDHKRGEDPELTTLQSLSLLQDEAMEIARKNAVPLKEAAHAAAMATAFIAKECTKDVGAETAFNIAVHGFIEGSKTSPPHPASPSVSGEKKPWYKLW
ncbi:hypothetical protein DES53_1011058 [Roseimicrobium gellanilyticum]|uniref:Uncharacterized protein n=1 Tax=Roseimicrobium gellanilyticum TaxID=748857 RepID=A0A366HVZ8_9BACT|nr:hypothetical protein [Roseimicrobium gellanilyticum]RBP48257.1 hypothetical protein DES53_1011058 [Roseimicrobium gellanilyticum]